MQIGTLTDLGIFPALRLLGPGFASREAVHLLRAIAVQESGLTHRAQIGGPARGWWQFERIGVQEVLRHRTTAVLATHFAGRLGYPSDAHILYTAIEHNDILAAGIARLALWRHPSPLPLDQGEAWDYYVRIWAPGHPRPEHWPSAWSKGELQ